MLRLRFCISGCLFCIFLPIAAIDVIQLAIAYDENESVVPENKAISMTMRDLFKARSVPILISGNLAIRMAYVFGEPLNNIKKFSGDLVTKKDEDYIAYKNKFFESIVPSDWYIYAVRDTSQHLMLFIPRAYVDLHNAHIGDHVDLEKLGFDSSALESIHHTKLLEKAIYCEFNPEKVASSIMRVFLKSKSKSNVIQTPTGKAWHIYFDGHGRSLEAGKSPMQALLKKRDGDSYVSTSAMVVGMPAHEFLKFITDIPAQIIVYNTCFGGGMIAESIHQLVSVAFSVAKKHITTDKSFPVIISIAGGEQTTSASYTANYEAFFKKMQEAFSPSIKIRDQQKKLLEQAIAYISNDTPIILFPSQEMDKTIKKTTLIEAKDGGGSVAEQSGFTYLKQPDFVLALDKNNRLSVSGALSNSERVKTTDSEITFEKCSDTVHVVLQTDLFDKKLIFKGNCLINFDVKTMSDHIKFKEITFTDLGLEKFLSTGFNEHGRMLRVSIEKLTAKNTLVNLHDSGDIVRVDDVELYAFPYYFSMRGNFILTHKNTWYIGEITDSNSLNIMRVIKIPENAIDRRELRSKILAQIELNGKLAYTLGVRGLSKNIQTPIEVINYFGEPMPYPDIAPKMLIDEALNLIKIALRDFEEQSDKYLGSKLAKLNSEQKEALITQAILLNKPSLAARFIILNGSPLPFANQLILRVLLICRDADRIKIVKLLEDSRKNDLMKIALLKRDSEAVEKLVSFGIGFDPSLEPALFNYIDIDNLIRIVDKLSKDQQLNLLKILLKCFCWVRDEELYSRFSKEQKKGILDNALLKKDIVAAGRLIVLGIQPTNADDLLVKLLAYLNNESVDDFEHDMARFSKEQRQLLLIAALSTYKYKLAQLLISTGIFIPASSPDAVYYGLAAIMTDSDAEEFDKISDQLNDEQKKTMLWLLLNSETETAAKLIIAGISPKAIDNGDLLCKMILTSGEQIDRLDYDKLIASFSIKQKNAILSSSFCRGMSLTR